MTADDGDALDPTDVSVDPDDVDIVDATGDDSEDHMVEIADEDENNDYVELNEQASVGYSSLGTHSSLFGGFGGLEHANLYDGDDYSDYKPVADAYSKSLKPAPSAYDGRMVNVDNFQFGKYGVIRPQADPRQVYGQFGNMNNIDAQSQQQGLVAVI